jgi:hypothetical protein
LPNVVQYSSKQSPPTVSISKADNEAIQVISSAAVRPTSSASRSSNHDQTTVQMPKNKVQTVESSEQAQSTRLRKTRQKGWGRFSKFSSVFFGRSYEKEDVLVTTGLILMLIGFGSTLLGVYILFDEHYVRTRLLLVSLSLSLSLSLSHTQFQSDYDAF